MKPQSTIVNPYSNDRIARTEIHTLSDSWYTLHKVAFDIQAHDDTWSRQEREVYDRGNGATVLLIDWDRETLLLTRQFRIPAYLNGHASGMLIETPAGLLDTDDAETAARRDARSKRKQVAQSARFENCSTSTCPPAPYRSESCSS